MSRRKKRKPPGGGGSSTLSNSQIKSKAFQPRRIFHSRWDSIAVCIGLAAAVWMVYGQTLGFDFVNYDDDEYVYNNPQVSHGLSFKAILWGFTHVHGGNWHPLTTLTHMLDCQLYGLHPWGHHLGNVLLHGTAAILLFLVLQQMTGAFWRSGFVAAVFALHPLHAESVAWISERKDVLSAVFFMLTLMAYVSYARKRETTGNRDWSFLHSSAYWLALLFFALGVMSKPMLVTLPFVLLLLDWWPLERFATGNERSAIGRLAWEKVPFLLLSAASCAATIWAQREAFMSLEKVGFPLRLGNALLSYVAYIQQMIYPTGLAVFYPHPANHLALWKVGASVLVLLLASAGIAIGSRKRPFLLVGWLWYLGMLVPVIGLMQVGRQAMADRYTYLPQIGLYIMLAWASVDLFASRPYGREILKVAAGAIIAILLVLAHVQTAYWKNSVSLMTHAIACTPDNAVAQNNLANALSGNGNLAAAIQYYERAIQIEPNDVERYNNLGNALAGQGNLREAVQRYEQAIQLKPDYAEAHYNLSVALAAQGKLGEAVRACEKAIQLRPDYAAAYNNLGNALAAQGKLLEAVQRYEQAIQLKPDYAEAYYNLGHTLAVEGNLPDAIQRYEMAIRLKPDYAEGYNNLGNVLVRQGNLLEAARNYEHAVRIKPNFVEAHHNLANTLAAQRKLPDAVQHYERVIQLKPDAAEAYNDLGVALAEQKNFPEAIRNFERALQLMPDYAEARNNLANVLSAQGKLP